MLLSKVSAALFWSEQIEFGFVSKFEQWSGSWKPQVSFRNYGWKKPTKPVLVVVLITSLVWSALNRLTQFSLLS